jgi:hypothetical protein
VTVVNAGGQECLTSGEQDLSYIQYKIKLNNAKKCIEIREGWGG